MDLLFENLTSANSLLSQYNEFSQLPGPKGTWLG
jgi:hypothetical protein